LQRPARIVLHRIAEPTNVRINEFQDRSNVSIEGTVIGQETRDMMLTAASTIPPSKQVIGIWTHLGAVLGAVHTAGNRLVNIFLPNFDTFFRTMEGILQPQAAI
jgi:RNase P/RNase MRP subunit p29